MCNFAIQTSLTHTIMGLLDFLFKSKKQREQEKRVKEVLERTDWFIERTEQKLDDMRRDDHRWIQILRDNS